MALDKALASERQGGDDARSEAARLGADLASARATLSAAESAAAQARQDLGEVRAEASELRRHLLDVGEGQAAPAPAAQRLTNRLAGNNRGRWRRRLR